MSPTLFAAGALGLGALAVAWILTAGGRRRRRILRRPFPEAWERILRERVRFYRSLDDAGRERFRRDVQVFLGETRVTGIGMEVDDELRVLTAASAAIPVFGFPDWEWTQIAEVLIYPDRFDDSYRYQGEVPRRISGMVGTGAMQRLMILSAPDLRAGFGGSGSRRNVGIHEFAHLLDKSDGAVDGLPEWGLDAGAVEPWLARVREEMRRMRAGDSDLDPYGLTNEAEFFAVAAEFFFQRPVLMRRKHPELYAALSRIFRQDLPRRLRWNLSAARPGGDGVGRNDPCPCGSGAKYKKCCLRREKRRRAARRRC